MARDPTPPASLQTDPQHRGRNGFPNSIILFKGKPYLWLANPHMARDKPTDLQPRVKGQDGRSLTSNVTPTPMKLKNEFGFGPPSRDPLLLRTFSARNTHVLFWAFYESFRHLLPKGEKWTLLLIKINNKDKK